MVNNNYVIQRILSRSITKEEFDFDRLQGPCIQQLFTPYDIDQLRQIATSIKLSSKLQEKRKLIDNIMRSRGFRMLISGTNRICYEYLENKSFVVKVAVDDVGRKDNPCEFRNQLLFKPFVTKVFDVSPCGTVGIFERVTPITNKEEFESVIYDIYTTINHLVGKYVIADFGVKFFMNWGLREGFGPVILDFPYIYETDDRKLICNAIDKFTGHPCLGEIDYDEGYNFLVCTKCGKQYKAADVRADGQSRKIIIRERGGYRMKVSISGGDKNISKTFTINEDGSVTDDRSLFGKVVTSTKQKDKPAVEVKKPNNARTITVNLNSTGTTASVVATPVVEEKKVEAPKPEQSVQCVNGSIRVSLSDKKEEPNKEEVVEDKETKETVEMMQKFVDITEEKGIKLNDEEVVCPIKFVTEEEKINAMSKIMEYINEIRKMSGMLTDDETIDLIDILIELESELDNRPNLGSKIRLFLNSIEKSALLLSKISDKDKKEAYQSEFVKEIVNGYDQVNCDKVEEVETPDVEEYTDEEEETTELGATGFVLLNAKIDNMKDIDPMEESKKVLVLTDDAENFILSADGKILAVDTINGRFVDSISIVSSAWLKEVSALNTSYDNNEDAEAEIEDEIMNLVSSEEVPDDTE